YLLYAIVPADGKPVLFAEKEEGLSRAAHADEDELVTSRSPVFWDVFPCGPSAMEPAARAWSADVKAVLTGLGVADAPLGVDRMDFHAMRALNQAGIQIGDALLPLQRARAIKTRDEIILIRQAHAIGEVGCWRVKQAIKPGVTEQALFSILA